MLPGEWDDLTREAWKTAPKMRGRLLAISPFLLGLLAVAAYPFDPTGATTHAIIGVTMKELFGVAVIGALFGVTGATALQRGLEKYIGHQQLSNFFAITCDRIGLPRDELPIEWANHYPPPKIAEGRKHDAFGVKERGWMRARLMHENIEQLRAALRAL